jgi:NitT/TauT family transport system substrate-binding protein
MDDKNRQKQLKVLKKGYDMAVDSINRHGVRHYSELVVKYCGVSPEKADSLPRDMKFEHMEAPRQKDIDQARKWLKK